MIPMIMAGAAAGALVGALIKQTDFGKQLDKDLEDGWNKLKDVLDFTRKNSTEVGHVKFSKKDYID